MALLKLNVTGSVLIPTRTGQDMNSGECHINVSRIDDDSLSVSYSWCVTASSSRCTPTEKEARSAQLDGLSDATTFDELLDAAVIQLNGVLGAGAVSKT